VFKKVDKTQFTHENSYFLYNFSSLNTLVMLRSRVRFSLSAPKISPFLAIKSGNGLFLYLVFICPNF